MKICKLIVSLFILLIILNISAEELYFRWNDNPAFNSEIYNKTFGFKLVNSDFDTFEQSGRVSYLHPSRIYGNTKFFAEYLKSDYSDQYTAQLSWGRRINPAFHLGAALEYSRLTEDNKNIISFLPGIQIKFTGNLRYSGYLYFQKHDDDQKTYLNSSLSYYVNSHLRTSISYETNEKCRTEIDFIYPVGISLFAESDLKGNIKNNICAGLVFSLNLTNSLLKLSGSVFNDPDDMQFRQSAEYIYTYGKYTPPVVYDAPLYPIESNSLNKYSLVTSQQFSESSLKDVIIVVKPGDNLTQISKNLPPNVLDHYKSNVAAISEYNGITDPSRIKAGQKIKVPVRIPVSSEVTVSDSDKEKIEEYLNSLITTNLAEIKVTQAYWNMQLKDVNAMKKHTPGNIINTPAVLNIKAIEAAAENNYEEAGRLLDQAIKMDSTSHIFLFNKSLIDFQTGKEHVAYDNLLKSIEFGTGSDYAFKIYNKLKKKILLKDVPDSVIIMQDSFRDSISAIPFDSLNAKLRMTEKNVITSADNLNFLTDEFEDYTSQKITYTNVINTSEPGKNSYIEAANMLRIINRKLEHLNLSINNEQRKQVLLNDNLNMLKLEVNRRKSW